MITRDQSTGLAVELFRNVESLAVDQQPAAVYLSGLTAERSAAMRFSNSSVFNSVESPGAV